MKLSEYQIENLFDQYYDLVANEKLMTFRQFRNALKSISKNTRTQINIELVDMLNTLLEDEDLTDEKLRDASEGLLPNLADNLNACIAEDLCLGNIDLSDSVKTFKIGDSAKLRDEISKSKN